jgi:hypothetical protein
VDPAEHERAERFSSIFEESYGRVHAYAARRVGRDSADDIAAETMLIAWRRREVLPADPLPWLYGIARNVVARHHEAATRGQGLVRSLEFQRADGGAAQGEDAAVAAGVGDARAARPRAARADRLGGAAGSRRGARVGLLGGGLLGSPAPGAQALRARACSHRTGPPRRSRPHGGVMTSQLPGSLVRLARANPVLAEAGLGRAPRAQAQLARILAREREAPRRRWRPRRRRVIAILIVATAFTGCGAALRVADPFGFWRSSTPGTARFGVSPAAHAVAPRANDIGCRLTGSATLTCVAGSGGIRYQLISHTFAAMPSVFSRARMLRALKTAVPAGEASAAEARRLRADIAAVPDSFFAAMRELGRFQTLTFGTSRVPPHGVPLLIVCQRQHATIVCRDLNGDEQTPVGTGIYAAVPAADWVSVPSGAAGPMTAVSERMIETVLGHPFTAAERRLMVDLARAVTPVRSHSGGAVVHGQTSTTASR